MIPTRVSLNKMANGFTVFLYGTDNKGTEVCTKLIGTYDQCVNYANDFFFPDVNENPNNGE